MNDQITNCFENENRGNDKMVVIRNNSFLEDLDDIFKNLKEVYSDDKQQINVLKNNPRVIAIGSGKGGVGKSIISTMLGLALSNMGKDTVIIDADFTGSNLHGYLNIMNPEISFSRYLDRCTYDLNELALKTKFENLRVIPVDPGCIKTVQMKFWEKQKLLRNLRKIKADYIILDLGAGSSVNTLDLFLAADEKVLVATCDPLSIYDAYGFVRSVLLRRLQKTFRHWPDFLQQIKECGDLTKGKDAKPIHMVLKEMREIPTSWKVLIKRRSELLQPKIILNMVHENDSHFELQALRLAIKELLNIGISYWGDIRYDENVRESTRNLRPELLIKPESKAIEDVMRFVNRSIIAKEMNAITETNESGWEHKKWHKAHNEAAEYVQICNYKCIAWNCCDFKDGGQPCRKITSEKLQDVNM